tara:strand:+ start:587 stop:844 length:258 start_codon:yes stop_codon:yes gene_type:complete
MERNNTYMSLYDYLGKAAGPDLGKKVFEAVKQSSEFVKVESKEVNTPYYQGKVLMYPKWYLDAYFDNGQEDEIYVEQNDDDELPF